MISYKSIDKLKIYIKDNILYYDESPLILKTCILKNISLLPEDYNKIEVVLDPKLQNDNKLKEVFLYIKRILTNENIICDILDNENIIHIIINKDSKFFDTDSRSLTKNILNKQIKGVVSLKIIDGFLFLHQFKRA